MATVNLQSVARDMSEYASELIQNVPLKIKDAPNEEIRRLTAASLADQDIGSDRGGSLRKLVQDYTQKLSSKETGFIAYALDVLKELFVQKRDEFSNAEIRTALKEQIPTLNIPLSSENMHADKRCSSFTFTTVEDKAGEKYNVTLWIQANDEPESLRIRSLDGRPYVDVSVPLTGPNVDTELLGLIKANPKILY